MYASLPLPSPSALVSLPSLFSPFSAVVLVELPLFSLQKSPGPSSDAKKPAHQPSILPHPLATTATHLSQPKLPLPTLRPPLPVIAGLHPPIIPLPLLPGQPAALPGKANILNSLPGLGVIRTSQMAVQPPVVKDYQAEAEFLLSQKLSRPASPPLTADEFYRQQKILHQFIL